MAEVGLSLGGFGHGRLNRLGGALDTDCVEKGRVDKGQSERGKACSESLGVLMRSECDLVKSFWPVVDGVHRGKGGKEGLGGANVAGGAVAANVLFAGLQGEAVGGAPGGVFGHAD